MPVANISALSLSSPLLLPSKDLLSRACRLLLQQSQCHRARTTTTTTTAASSDDTVYGVPCFCFNALPRALLRLFSTLFAAIARLFIRSSRGAQHREPTDPVCASSSSLMTLLLLLLFLNQSVTCVVRFFFFPGYLCQLFYFSRKGARISFVFANNSSARFLQ